MKVLLAHGPNLNLLGTRSPEIYGTQTLADVEELVAGACRELGVALDTFQSNHEGALLDRLHSARTEVDGILLNAGAWTHYSYALRDAIEAISVPTVEVHISDVKSREEFRRHSVIEDVCIASVVGKGVPGYLDALRLLHEHLIGER